MNLHQKSLKLRKALVQEQGAAEDRRDLAVSYCRVGDSYKALGGQANLKRVLELYQKGLELFKALARELNTVSAYDDLAISYYQVGSCMPEGSEERRRYLVQCLELSEQLFRQTQSERHKTFVSAVRQLLDEVKQEAPPADHSTKASLWSRLFGRRK